MNFFAIKIRDNPSNPNNQGYPIFWNSILNKSQVIRAAITATHINQLNFIFRLRNEIPIIVQILEIVGQIEIQIEVEADGFLYNMVRTIAGTLILVGSGRWSPDSVAQIIASADRKIAGPTAPAKGLAMLWVKYSI